jgi:hypothetical protein
MEKFDVLIFKDNDVEIEVNVSPHEETVWLSQKQIAELFNKERSVISRHIHNVFREGELDESTSVQKMHRTDAYRPEKQYNLDVVISVGYRVHSQKGVAFRKWANKILKDYLIKGYAINEKRMKIPNLVEITTLLDAYRQTDGDFSLSGNDILQFLIAYNRGLTILDNYDHHTFKTPEGIRDTYLINYNECKDIIIRSKFYGRSDNFAKERDKSFYSSISTIYQTFDGKELYPTLESKAANLLYLITKNHSFIDGNKRIASTIFLYFLDRNKALFISGNKRINDETLAALTILIAASDPKDKELLVNLILVILG